MSHSLSRVLLLRPEAERRALLHDHGAAEMRDCAKNRSKSLELDGAGKVRVNMAGCLDRCDESPVMVVYHVDEIVRSHIRVGCPVERLRS